MPVSLCEVSRPFPGSPEEAVEVRCALTNTSRATLRSCATCGAYGYCGARRWGAVHTVANANATTPASAKNPAAGPREEREYCAGASARTVTMHRGERERAFGVDADGCCGTAPLGCSACSASNPATSEA